MPKRSAELCVPLRQFPYCCDHSLTAFFAASPLLITSTTIQKTSASQKPRQL